MEWMILPLRRYAQFSGRSRRKEYWMFTLLTVIVSPLLGILDTVLGFGGTMAAHSTATANGFAAGGFGRGGLLSSIWSFGVLVPSIAVSVRRLHDIGRSGWWLLAPLVLFALGAILIATASWRGTEGVTTLGTSGYAIFALLLILAGGVVSIILFVWMCTNGTHGANRFGSDPKGHVGDLHETFS